MEKMECLALYHGEIGECLALDCRENGECLALDRGKIWRVLSTLKWRKNGECLAVDHGKIWRVLSTISGQNWRGKPTKQAQPFSMPGGPLNQPNNY